MAWSSLGMPVEPEPDQWKFFDTPDINGQLFRVRQSYTYGYVPGKLLVVPYYATHDAYGDVAVLYPDPSHHLLELPIPKRLLAEGIVTRDIAIRSNFFSRQATIDNWRVEIEVWI